MDCAKRSIDPYRYERHRPEESLLYQVVAKNLDPFLKECDESSHPVPKFIKKEFDAFLRCGVLSHGFARVYCQSCKYDRLVAFSCKKRGFCGSCLARRMSDTAGRLTSEVIPHIPTRQWVLSLPMSLRFLTAYDHYALLAVVSVFMGVLFVCLRRKAKDRGGKILGATEYHPGAISFIQRFGSSLNLNVHVHSQVSDGIYARLPDGQLRFIRVPPPTDDEMRRITIKIARRMHRYLEKRMAESGGDGLEAKEPLLARCYAASLRSLTALGLNWGKPLMRLIAPDLIKAGHRDDCTIMGFNLHASKAIEVDDREGLERTLRYMGRPPLSKDRLKMAADKERLILTLKSPWRDGTEKILLTPFELLERLVAIIPLPRKNLIRYHGFLAPNAHLRKEVLVSGGSPAHPVLNKKICRPDFAKLMARVFGIDVLECPRCKSRMQRISFVQDPKATADILRSLKMTTAPPDICEPERRVIEYDIDQVHYINEFGPPITNF